MDPSRTIEIVAVLLFLVWLFGYIANVGLWVHALLVAALLLVAFDLMAAKQKAAKQK